MQISLHGRQAERSSQQSLSSAYDLMLRKLSPMTVSVFCYGGCLDTKLAQNQARQARGIYAAVLFRPPARRLLATCGRIERLVWQLGLDQNSRSCSRSYELVSGFPLDRKACGLTFLPQNSR